MDIRWKRKRDGVVVITRQRWSHETDSHDTLAKREDNGRAFWITWAGLRRKYEVEP